MSPAPARFGRGRFEEGGFMVRALVTATVSAALCTASSRPAWPPRRNIASLVSTRPRGVTATVNLRVPFGRTVRRPRQLWPHRRYGQTVGRPSTATATRAVNLADLRFSGGASRRRGRQPRPRDLDQDRRLNLVGEEHLAARPIIVGAILICVSAVASTTTIRRWADEATGPTRPAGPATVGGTMFARLARSSCSCCCAAP